MKVLRPGILAFTLIFLAGCASEMKRGSEETLYTIASTLEVNRNDIGKDIQLKLNQYLFFHFEIDPNERGQWKLVNHDPKTLLLLNENPRTAPGHWGSLFQARGIGSGEVQLRFVPVDKTQESKEVVFEFSVRR